MILKNNKRIDGCSDTVPIGTLNPFLGSTAPYGYLICQGQKVSKTVYKELYEICGDTFGQSTDTEFYLPDLRGQTIAGYKEGDSTFGTLGGLIGSLTHLHHTGNHTLTVAEMPSHTHIIEGVNPGASATGQLGNQPLRISNDTIPQWRANNPGSTGGGQAHNHGDTSSTSSVQPTIVLNWIIKAFQLMPNQSYVSTVSQDSNTNTYSCNYINDKIVPAGGTTGQVLTKKSDTNNDVEWVDQTGGSADYDSLPVGSVVEYEGDTVPVGYEQVTDPNTYSTEEVKTNKIWIDGKPIYRRVVTGTVNAPNQGQDVTTISNLRQILTMKGVMYSNYGQWWNIPNYHGELGYANSINCDVNGKINLSVGNFYGADKPFIVILEYTKTTD